MLHDRCPGLHLGTVPAAALLALGCAAGPDRPATISNSGAGAYEAALAVTREGAVAAWYDTRDGNGEIYMRLLDRRGRPRGPERRLTSDAEESYEPSIQSLADAVVVAWYGKAPDGTLTTRLGAWSRDGERRWTTTVATAARNPVVRSDGRRIAVAWIQKDADGAESVWLGEWDTDGAAAGSSVRLAAAHSTTWNLNAVLGDDGAVWVVFDAIASTQESELFLARADASGVTLTRLSADDGHESKYPDLAIAGGRAALTWFDAKDGNTEVYLVTVETSALTRSGIEANARRVTTTPGESIGAYLAWNGDRLGLAWCDNTPGQHETYFQPFDASGRPVAEPVRLTSNDTSSLVPAIESWHDGFALAWNEYTPASDGHEGKSEIAFAIVR